MAHAAETVALLVLGACIFPCRGELSWTSSSASANVPPACTLAGTAAVGHRLYTFGGNFSGNFLSDVWIYDAQGQQWMNLPIKRPIKGRILHGMAAIGTMLLVHGGWDGSNAIGDLWALDTNSQNLVWNDLSYLQDAPTPRHGHSFVFAGGYIVAFGGADTSLLGDLRILDLTATPMTWSNYGNLPGAPTPRMLMGAAAIGSKVYLMGGWDQARRVEIHGFFSLDVSKEPPVWTDLSSIASNPSGSYRPAMVAIGSTLLFLSGSLSQDEYQTFEMYTLETKSATWSWMRLQTSPPLRLLPAMAAAYDNVFIFGGIQNVPLAYAMLDISHVDVDVSENGAQACTAQDSYWSQDLASCKVCLPRRCAAGQKVVPCSQTADTSCQVCAEQASGVMVWAAAGISCALAPCMGGTTPNKGRTGCISTHVWRDFQTEQRSTPPARNLSRCAVMKEGVLVMFGGQDGAGPSAALFVLNLRDVIPLWQDMTGLSGAPSPRSMHAMAQVAGMVLVYGGKDAQGTPLGDMHVFDGSQWMDLIDTSAIDTKPQARALHGLAAIGRRAFVFGGVGEGGITLGDLHVLTASNDGSWVWTDSSNLAGQPSPRSAVAMAAVESTGSVFVFGGVDARGIVCQELYEIVQSGVMLPRWVDHSKQEGMHAAAAGALMTSVGSTIYVFGGTSQSGAYGGVSRLEADTSPPVWASVGTLDGEPIIKVGGAAASVGSTVLIWSTGSTVGRTRRARENERGGLYGLYTQGSMLPDCAAYTNVWSDGVSPWCNGCTNLICRIGMSRVPCTANADARCVPCAQPSRNQLFAGEECKLYNCPKGKVANADRSMCVPDNSEAEAVQLKGIFAGSIVGGFVVLMCCAAALVVWYLRRKKQPLIYVYEEKSLDHMLHFKRKSLVFDGDPHNSAPPLSAPTTQSASRASPPFQAVDSHFQSLQGQDWHVPRGCEQGLPGVRLESYVLDSPAPAINDSYFAYKAPIAREPSLGMPANVHVRIGGMQQRSPSVESESLTEVTHDCATDPSLPAAVTVRPSTYVGSITNGIQRRHEEEHADAGALCTMPESPAQHRRNVLLPATQSFTVTLLTPTNAADPNERVKNTSDKQCTQVGQDKGSPAQHEQGKGVRAEATCEGAPDDTVARDGRQDGARDSDGGSERRMQHDADDAYSLLFTYRDASEDLENATTLPSQHVEHSTPPPPANKALLSKYHVPLQVKPIHQFTR